MAQDVLTLAWKYMRRRKFSTALNLLESKAEVYEDDFEYYLVLGIACLYAGDIGSATSSFQVARRIKMTDPRLLLGQAAIFLRRGDTDRALQYYLEVREYDPANQIATDAIEFIRTRGDFDTICRWADTGRLEQFYPPLGVNPDRTAGIVIPIVALVLGIVVAFSLIPRNNYADGKRKDLTELTLTKEEEKAPQETDLSTQSFKYILSNKQITESYSNILMYFQARRDNAVQIEINRLLNSNAKLTIKQKVSILMTYLETPTFDSITDVPTYAQVDKDAALYLDCYVDWAGRISDAVVSDDGTYTCRLLVGYESGEKIDGIVNVRFDKDPKIVPDQSVRILGKLCQEDKKIFLQGKAVYQSVKEGLTQ
ncbi:MAG: hypothetical protein MJ179_05275 [Treponema sp.]|nr:hypothetical protein [Treponema sp.]